MATLIKRHFASIYPGLFYEPLAEIENRASKSPRIGFRDRMGGAVHPAFDDNLIGISIHRSVIITHLHGGGVPRAVISQPPLDHGRIIGGPVNQTEGDVARAAEQLQ